MWTKEDLQQLVQVTSDCAYKVVRVFAYMEP